MRVRAYRNLHFKDRVVWSVQHYNKHSGSWLTILHNSRLLLKNAEFKVSEAGRQKVLREKRKTVHAFVYGDLIVTPDSSGLVHDIVTKGIYVTYNPYKYETFVRDPKFQAHGLPIEAVGAKFVFMGRLGHVSAYSPD